MPKGLYVIIPVKSLTKTKTRLSSIIKPTQRRTLNLLTLKHVMQTIVDSEQVEGTIVVSPDPAVKLICRQHGAIFLQEKSNRGVNAAVAKGVDYCKAQGAAASLVIPSDLPSITTEDIAALAKIAEEPRVVVITPSMRLDGTNILLRKPADIIKTFYDQNSFPAHLQEAKKTGAKLLLYLSKTVMLDLDTGGDIALFLEEQSQTEAHTYLSSVMKNATQKNPSVSHIKNQAIILQVQ
ncbi:MAG: 2-phospho-L-lactate guanylyltransferase [Thaumarchaeota archaeon]|nr:2-phospho-L-lactate guanylyltransferase [Nitrososphaerota archaeon]